MPRIDRPRDLGSLAVETVDVPFAEQLAEFRMIRHWVVTLSKSPMVARTLAYCLSAWTVFVIFATVGHELTTVNVRRSFAGWQICSVGPNGEVLRVVWTSVPSREIADGWVDQIALHDKNYPEIDSEIVELAPPDRFGLFAKVKIRTSPYRIVQDTYSYPSFAVIVVEFADGARWAKAVELPDPRTAGVIDIDFRTGRRLPPRSR